MKITRVSALSLTALLLNNENIFAADRVVPLSAIGAFRRSGHVFVIGRHPGTLAQRGVTVFANRGYSHSNNSDNDYSGKAKIFESLLKSAQETNKWLQEIKKELNAPRNRASLESPNSDAKISNLNGEIHSFQEKVKNDSIDFRYNFKNVETTRREYIRGIITMSSDPHKIDQDGLIQILDVFTALPRRSTDGISRVLSGEINTGKSLIYAEILAHANSKGIQLATYRNIYAELSKYFDVSFFQVLDNVAEKMMKDQTRKDISKINPEKLSPEESLEIIIATTNPLYPIAPEEIIIVGSLYSNLTHRSTDSISRVLSGEINTGKSTIYAEILAHANSKGIQLATYRNMYGRLIRSSLKKDVIHFVCSHAEAKKDTKVDQSQTIEGGKSFVNPLEICATESDMRYQDLLTTPEYSFSPEDSDLKKDKYPRISASASPGNTSGKENERLKQLYGFLPEYHGKSITGVLSGRTVNKNLPIWTDMEDAINKIRDEALAEGDKTLIDFNYFRNVFSEWQKKSIDKSQMRRDVYTISEKEIKRLNKLYEALPEYHGKSITGVLSGETINKALPIWTAVESAISKIQKEALAEGDKTLIDFNYFKKLHWASVRVFGRGGGRKQTVDTLDEGL